MLKNSLEGRILPFRVRGKNVQVEHIRLQPIPVKAANAMTDDLDSIVAWLFEANPLVEIDRKFDGLGLKQGRPRPAMSSRN